VQAATLAELRAALTQALGKYCIPKEVDSCEQVPYASAGTTYRAEYDISAGKCKCPCVDMYYDAAKGRCFDCDVSTADQYATACGAQSCTAGYELRERAVAVNGVCTAGYELGTGNIERACATGIGPSSCRSGYELRAVNII
jgi:hypothetical protein